MYIIWSTKNKPFRDCSLWYAVATRLAERLRAVREKGFWTTPIYIYRCIYAHIVFYCYILLYIAIYCYMVLTPWAFNGTVFVALCLRCCFATRRSLLRRLGLRPENNKSHGVLLIFKEKSWRFCSKFLPPFRINFETGIYIILSPALGKQLKEVLSC